MFLCCWLQTEINFLISEHFLNSRHFVQSEMGQRFDTFFAQQFHVGLVSRIDTVSVQAIHINLWKWHNWWIWTFVARGINNVTLEQLTSFSCGAEDNISQKKKKLKAMNDDFLLKVILARAKRPFLRFRQSIQFICDDKRNDGDKDKTE